ncbi:tigger transposable element-derived protein 6-like [Ylistrum balloti]|uniref:tigger transposable element-derived protein 6-like n=1 Tax=Ylistrum balloti TaxID=509963 RepID=UPI0029059D25|nr:tigger transposable element-derived protein 6-like [Ylistrum balloti]
MSKSIEQSNEGPGLSGGILGSIDRAKTGVKRKIETKTVETKYRAILAVEKGDRSKSDIAREFGIPANTLSTWLKAKEKIMTAYSNDGISPSRKKVRTAKYEDTETALLKWFTHARDNNLPVTGPMLKAKAKDLAEKIGEQNFACSTGWLDRFKDRHNISFKKICGEAKSVDIASDAMTKWADDLRVILSEYQPQDIFNADETGIFFRLLPNRTLDFKGTDCHGGKRSKERQTLLRISDDLIREDLRAQTNTRTQSKISDYFSDFACQRNSEH